MYYPLMLKVKGEPCLVVGGGATALKKARGLKQAGGVVTVISPSFCPAFERLAVRRVRRRFKTGDVVGRILVIAATDSSQVNRAVSTACRKRGIPVNVVDVPELCSFIVPSVLRRGPVVIAVSTGGQSPPLAQALRRQVQAVLPSSLGRLAIRLGSARRKILETHPPSSARTRLLKGLVRGIALRGLERR